MPKAKAWPLSEGAVCLNRTHQGPGVRVHRCDPSGSYEFVRIYAHRCASLEEPPLENPDFQMATFRIMIGQREKAVVVSLTEEQLRAGAVLIDNVSLSGSEEIWISSSQPNACMVHGLSSLAPFAR